MVSSATRRKRLREVQRVTDARRRADDAAAGGFETDDDGVIRQPAFGIELMPWRSNGGVRGRLRWLVDRDPFLATVSLARLRELLDALEVNFVSELRAERYSWDDVGFALGVTGEAARKKFARAVADLEHGEP